MHSHLLLHCKMGFIRKRKNMVKFKVIDNTTREASSNEVDRIYSSFKERVSTFCERYKIDFNATVILNPNLVEYRNIIRLKENVYCFVDTEVKHKLSDAQYSDIVQKLRFFTFENLGINNLLFILGEYRNDKNETIIEPISQTGYPIEALFQTSSVINSIASYVSIEKLKKQRSMICIFGDAYSGKTTCALSIAKSLNRKAQIISNLELFNLKQNFVKKLFEANNDNVFIFENIDYLFSDFKGNVPSIDLTGIRDNIIKYWSRSNNIIIFTVKSTEFIPSSFTNRFALVLGLDKPNIDIRRRIAKDLLSDDNIVDFISKEVKSFSLGRYIDVVNELKLLENIAALDVSICKAHLSQINSSISALDKNIDVDYRLESPSTSIDDVILPQSSKDKLKMALTAVVNRDYLINTIGWNEIDPNIRSIINFFGPPGTGKTMTARAIASYMTEQTGCQYELLSLNYSEIESKYVGDAPKKLEKAFNYAKDKHVVMFFDEADSFLGKRISNVEHGADQAINSLRSTMLIQLEKYTGIVIFATNLTCNYDKAFKTRFLADIEFKMPDQSTLAKIFRANLPKKLLSNLELWEDGINDTSFEKMGEEAVGLSGRDVRNINQRVILKNINKKLTLQMFLDEISIYKEEQKSERDFSKNKQASEPQPLPADVEKALATAQPVVNDDCEKLKQKINN